MAAAGTTLLVASGGCRSSPFISTTFLGSVVRVEPYQLNKIVISLEERYSSLYIYLGDGLKP
jgi:hypothetical protein